MKLKPKRGIGIWRAAVVAGVCLLATSMPGMAAELRAWVGMGPPLKYGTWTIVTGKVMNPAKTDLQGLLVVMADSAPDVQFSTPIWMPPESRVQVPLPFLTESRELLGLSTNVTVRLVHTSGGMDQTLTEDHSPQLNQTGDAPTGICVSRDDEDVGLAVSRLRAAQRRKPKSSAFDSRHMPTSAMGLMSFSDFVYGASEPLSVAQALALREWMFRGGHLWIVGDRANRETVRLIMGNEWTCQEVGRTELPSVAFTTGKQTEPATEYMEPVQMLRMVAPGMEVTQTVDGWPAVMWRGMGKGSVLFTTLEPRSLGKPTSQDPFPYWFELMSTRFLGPVGKPGEAGVSPRQTETHEAMHSLSLSIVGHAVVQRAPVLLILGVLGGVLVVFGWGFGRKRRLELLAPTAVVASVLATGSMLMLGAMGRGSTPLTVAGMAEGQISADSPRVVFDGVADIYSPSAFEGSIVAPLGGWTKPELSTQRGHLLRMRWAELEPMRWDHVHFPSATLKSTISGTAMATEAISARGTFDMHGFRGQMNGASGQWESVIVGPGGRLAPVFSSNGNFVAGEAQELRPGETTRGNINITPEIRHRIEAMQPWVAAKSHTSDVVMYTWTSALETGVGVEQDGAGAIKSERKLMTLLSAPLQIERPVGRFIIPPAFIKLNSARVAKIGGMTPVYDERNYAFMGKIPTGATSTIRFAVPREVLPLKVEKYNLRVDMSAPDREVSVFAIRRGQEGRAAIRKVKAFSRPAGPISVDIPGDADLQLDADGTVILGLEVSGPADPNNTTSTWTLNDMLLSVTASTQGEENK